MLNQVPGTRELFGTAAGGGDVELGLAGCSSEAIWVQM